jgi:hypothetical protein
MSEIIFSYFGATSVTTTTGSGTVTVTITFPATADLNESYNGQVYNMDSSDREALNNLPNGSILAKSDDGWDDTHNEDTDSSWWLEVGSITDNKITISLPESVDESFFRDDDHSKFGADFKLGVTGPRKRLYLVKDFVAFPEAGIDWYTAEINVLYLKTAQPNYVDDEEKPELTLNLDAGWNFYIRTEDTVTKIDSLDSAYQDGFKWYLHDEANEGGSDPDPETNTEIPIGSPSVMLYRNMPGGQIALEHNGETFIGLDTGLFTVRIAEGEYDEITWRVNGNPQTQAQDKTSISLSTRTAVTYLVTVEVVPTEGSKNSGAHTFVVE